MADGRCRSAVEAAVKAARKKEAERWRAKCSSLSEENDAHIHVVRVLQKAKAELHKDKGKLQKDVARLKRWEAVAAKHLQELNALKEKLAEAEEEKLWLWKKVKAYRGYIASIKLWWDCVQRSAKPDTKKWLNVIWKKGPKPPSDRGWGGGQ